MLLNKKNMIILSFSLLLILLLGSQVILADPPLSNFKFKTDQYIDFQDHDYIPINEVARSLDYDLNWRLSEDQVRGNLDNKYFSSNNFIIYKGQLYLTKDFYRDNFGLNIEIRGNWYYIYSEGKSQNDENKELEIQINTDKTKFEDDEAFAVSIILFNKSDDKISLKYTSGQKYDLVIERYNREVWRFSDGKGYIPSINTLNIAAGDYKLFTELIDEDLDLYRGSYELYAEIKADNQVRTSNKIKLEIDS